MPTQFGKSAQMAPNKHQNIRQKQEIPTPWHRIYLLFSIEEKPYVYCNVFGVVLVTFSLLSQQFQLHPRFVQIF